MLAVRVHSSEPLYKRVFFFFFFFSTRPGVYRSELLFSFSRLPQKQTANISQGMSLLDLIPGAYTL